MSSRIPLRFAILSCLLTPLLSGQTCRLIADLEPGSKPSAPAALTCVFGDTLVFSASSPSVGQEPRFLRNGGAPILIKDIRPRGDSFPQDFVQCGNSIFFTADDGTHGRELWITDLTTTGTRLVKDIRAGGLSSAVSDIVCVGSRVVFRAADSAHGSEIWASDGTASGTVMLRDIRPGTTGSDPTELTLFGGRAFFAANDGTNGVELWVSDGTVQGTFLVKDLNPGSPSGSPSNFHVHNGELYFRARAARLGMELWHSDGSPQGTALFRDFNPGLGDSNPGNFVSSGNKLFFTATTTPTGYELYVYDASGPHIVRDIRPGGGSSSPANLTECNGTVFFVAFDGTHGQELWKSDGTASGTVMVKDIQSGSSSSYPTYLLCVGRHLYFQADDGSAVGLWTSDGTTSGTQQLCSGVTFPRYLTLCGCRVYFSGFTPQTSHEPYVIDLPGASVTQFGATCAPQHPTMTSTLPVIGTAGTLSGTGGPANSLGVVLLDTQPRRPFPLPGGCEGYVQPTLVLGVAVTSKWTLPLPIPNNSSLDGACAALQTWWLTLGPIIPIRTTNGLLLGIGR